RPRATAVSAARPRRAAAGGSRGAGRSRARPPPRRGSERGEQVDGHAVGVADLRVAVTPERVPGLLLALEAVLDDLRVQAVHLGRAAAGEGERNLVPRLPRP